MLLSVRRLALVVICACLCVLTGGAASAWAGEGFGPESARLPEPPGGFENPLGIAVNQATGNVYVSDYSSGMIDEFNASKEYVSQIKVPGGNPYSLAVDNSGGSSQGDVYVAGAANNIVYKFDALPDGSLVPDATTPEIGFGLLERPVGVAVDHAGDVLVASEASGTISKFSPTGQVLDAALITGLREPQAIAVGPESDLYVASTSRTGGIVTYGPAGECIDSCALIDAGDQDRGVAVTAGGDVLVGDQSSGKALQYGAGPTHPLIHEFGSFALTFGIAVNEVQRTAYVADFVEKKVDTFESGPTPSEAPETGSAEASHVNATVHGILNPSANATAGWYFAYNNNGTCTGGNSTSIEPEIEGEALAETANLTNLQPLTTYTYCMVSYTKYGFAYGAPKTFTTQTPPLIAGESFSKAGQHGATVSAQLNTGGLATTYYVEYGSTSAYGSSTLVRVTGEGEGTVGVSARIEALQSYSEYYFRVVASNSDGAEERGEGLVFRTLPVPTNGLPDERVYEMVDPANNLNQDVYRPEGDQELEEDEGFGTLRPIQVAADGSAISYEAGATVGGGGSSGKFEGTQYLATRSVGGGWSQKTLSPDGRNDYFVGLDRELDAGVIIDDVDGLSALSVLVPENSYSMIYACMDLGSGCRTPEEPSRTGVSEFAPFFTVKPPNRTGSAFGIDSEEVNAGNLERSGPLFAGGSSGFTSLLFEANDALVPGEGSIERELRKDVEQEVGDGEDHSYLYDSVGGKLALIDVLPGSQGVPAGTVASHAIFGATAVNEPVNNLPDFSNVISADGRRVYWTDLASGADEGRVFLRENPGAPVSPVDSEGHCLVSVDACTVPVSAGAARYWTSAEDGRFAFYTEAGALYRFDAVTGVSEALTKNTADVLGVIGTSENGEDAYFVAEEAVGSVHGPGGTAPQWGEPNVYLSDNGTVTFVTTLAFIDGTHVEPIHDTFIGGALEVGDWVAGLGNRTAGVTPDGDGLVFTSSEKLRTVGFPNGVPNGGLQEVYLFQSGSDELFCVSCSPSGETPQAASEGETPAAAAFPAVSWSDTYEPQWVSDDGNEVFFDSVVPLVPQDTNGKQDVYEREREGTGSCTTGSGANGGCLYLLSSGSSEQASWLLGSSANGEDVFIVTRSRLTPNDGDEADNLFDVRAHGERPVEEGMCTGTGCQGVPAPPPTFATPPSVTFEGIGNFPPPVATKTGKSIQKTVVKCRKPRVRKNGKCVEKKRKHKRKRVEKRSRASRRVIKHHRRAA